MALMVPMWHIMWRDSGSKYMHPHMSQWGTTPVFAPPCFLYPFYPFLHPLPSPSLFPHLAVWVAWLLVWPGSPGLEGHILRQSSHSWKKSTSLRGPTPIELKA